jgi:hypothetical protein
MRKRRQHQRSASEEGCFHNNILSNQSTAILRPLFFSLMTDGASEHFFSFIQISNELWYVEDMR